MSYRPVTTTGFDEPLTLAEVRAHLRIEQDDETEDTLLTLCIAAAREDVELAGHLLVAREWDLVLDEFPDDAIKIEKTPVREIVSVTYNGATLFADYITSLSARDVSRVRYAVDGEWPETQGGLDDVVVRFAGGYVSTADIPSLLKSAMLLHIADMHEHREETIVGNIVNARGVVRDIYNKFGIGWWVVA